MIEELHKEVHDYLSVKTFNQKWEKDKKIGSGFFYAQTYHPILFFFNEHKPLSELLELKVALIFSWNPTICKFTPDRFKEAVRQLADLEKTIQKELDTKDLLSIDITRVIKELWYPVKKATAKVDTNSGVSVTKFLHFSFPPFFPMIDGNTMAILGGSSVNLKWYSIFLSAWKDLYSQKKDIFDQISSATNMPVARVLDVMVFNPA